MLHRQTKSAEFASGLRKGKENKNVVLRNRKANGIVVVRKGKEKETVAARRRKEKTVAVKLDASGKHNQIDKL